MSTEKIERLKVDVDLLEVTPTAGGLWHWMLASPALLFLAWNWIALLDALRVTNWSWLNILIGCVTFIVVWVLPLGYAAHWLVTAFPRIFQAAGWEEIPREEIADTKFYMAQRIYKDRERASTNWNRVWLRVAQGWVYLEIFGIFLGVILMAIIFFSVLQFGFGQ
ncbi:MAG: hypothetical protein AAF702_39330 [Chloroflexota bacterium]